MPTPTGTVVIGETIASVDPAGIVTAAGTSTPGMSEMIRTVAPPGGAGPFNVTRACVDAPPSTVPGSGIIHSRSSPAGVVADAAAFRRVAALRLSARVPIEPCSLRARCADYERLPVMRLATKTQGCAHRPTDRLALPGRTIRRHLARNGFGTVMGALFGKRS